MKILIIGHGFVGQAVDYAFQHPDIEKTIIDPKYGNSLDDVDMSNYSVAFVCVPTPMGKDGVDTSILHEVLNQIKGNPLDPQIKGNVVTIIKSTVTPDFFKNLPDTVVYNPEFLVEQSAKNDIVNPDYHIIGGTEFYVSFVEKLYENYSLCSPCPVFKVSREEASMIKYAINSFLATKVTFFNQIYDACQRADMNFNKVIQAVGSDPRIGHSHTKVPGFDSKQGYGGACFPKDTSALVNYDKGFTLIEKCIRINNEYRSQYDLDEREKEQNVHYE